MDIIYAKIEPRKNGVHHFGSNAQFKKLDSHLLVRIFGKLMHPSVVERTLVSGVMLNFPLLITYAIFVRLASLKYPGSKYPGE